MASRKYNVHTPMFVWPDIGDGETYDKSKKVWIYPRSRNLPLYRNLNERVASIVNLLEFKAGNIIPMIAKDLASPSAADELELLPVCDYVCSTYAHNITDACKSMVAQKIQRYRVQHAHDLAVSDSIDISVSWNCQLAVTEEAVLWVRPDEAETVKQAHCATYKYHDWNSMFADEKEKDDPDEWGCGEVRQPTRTDKSKPLPVPQRKGGFFACVPMDLYKKLKTLSPVWGITVDVVVYPMLMTDGQQKEMAAYFDYRRRAEEHVVEREERREEEEQRLADIDYHACRHRTYGNMVAVQHERFKRLNVHVDQGGAPR